MRKELVLIIIAGVFIGIAAVTLVSLGNIANMGFCIGCFERDIAAAMGLHDFRIFAWIRPEIIGILLGAFLAAFFTKEFHPEGGSSPITRFLLGMLVMIGMLTFLGCPLRMILRIGGGDLNAVVGLIGLTVGVSVGVIFLRKGFSLGRTQKQGNLESLVMPTLMIGLLIILIFLPVFKTGGPIFVAGKGHPGTPGTPVSQSLGIIISLGFGLIVGILAQKARLCLVGGIRDIFLIRNTFIVTGFLAILLVTLACNIIFGKFHLGFENQPVAHTAHLWNFLGMALVGLGSVFLGACPLRQIILSGNGNTDSALAVLGMFAGAAIVHNFGLDKAATVYGKAAVIIALIVVLIIGYVNREKLSD
ncbi:MAG: YedE family putative selenium transporter [Planctomycetota bacterium]